MSAQLKIPNINSHVVDILASVSRDQPVMKMDKAVELVKCLDEEIFINDNYVFFDPFCKAGEILLASALVSILYKSKRNFVSMDKVCKEMYQSNRYFAMAPDERHYNLSCRTFYGNEKSHNLDFTTNIRNGAYLSETDGRLDKQKFNKELLAMLEYIKEKTGNKKIIAVGNPPYQEDTAGYGKQAKPIYHHIVRSLTDSKQINELVIVIPSRWFSGGMGLDDFRKQMIKCKKIKKIKYFEKSHDIFPTVDIRGGVCFFYWKRNFSEKTKIFNNNEILEVDLFRYDIILPHLNAYSILDKILSKTNSFVSEIVLPISPFNLSSNYFTKNKEDANSKNQLECFTAGKNLKRISKEKISKNIDQVYKYNVSFPEAIGGGKKQRHKVLPKPNTFFIIGKGQISTATYCISKGFNSLREAENFRSFLGTYFSRFLLGLRKPTQHTSSKTFSWVPLMDTKRSWNDEQLFEHFKITKEEQKYIKEQVEKWTA